MYPHTFEDILKIAADAKASDIHFVAEQPPVFRLNGHLRPAELPVISGPDLKETIFNILNDKQKESFEKTKELDFSFKSAENFQCRANVHQAGGNVAATIRITPMEIADSETLGLPGVVCELARRQQGLVIVCGMAGSGKSTTMNCMIDQINRERECKIITIEDPVEFVHKPKKGLIVQREVGADTDSFASALKYALRQDPDVVVIGEMRDLESISMALTTAETGHLVFTTVHALDAVETINRIIDVYPIGNRDQICAQLAGNLIAVIAQTLVPDKEGTGRRLATEVMISTIAIQNLIRRGALSEIRGQLDAEADTGMHSLEKSLSRMYKRGLITKEIALNFTRNPHLLEFEDEETEVSGLKRKRTVKPLIDNQQVKQKKILIIDGRQEDNERLRSVLAENGFTMVASAERGIIGLDRAKKEKPDVVVLDTDIPDFRVDAYKVCRALKMLPEPKPKVIIQTVNMKDNTAAMAREAGADDFVVKTRAFDLVLKAINRLYEDE